MQEMSDGYDRTRELLYSSCFINAPKELFTVGEDEPSDMTNAHHSHVLNLDWPPSGHVSLIAFIEDSGTYSALNLDNLFSCNINLYF